MTARYGMLQFREDKPPRVVLLDNKSDAALHLVGQNTAGVVWVELVDGTNGEPVLTPPDWEYPPVGEVPPVTAADLDTWANGPSPHRITAADWEGVGS